MTSIPSASEQEVSRLLQAWGQGNAEAFETLIPLVYDPLRQLAARYLKRERSDHTLDTGALVHEVFLRLRQQDRTAWSNREQFFAISAQMMRRILADHARYHGFHKRGGQSIQVPLEQAEPLATALEVDQLALHQALQALAKRSPEQARIVSLKFFRGLSKPEVAEVMGLSTATVARRWRLARAWLYRYLQRGQDHGQNP